MLPCCALVRRIMVRKGWSVEDDLSKAFWKRILMGPRPPSTRWPPAQRAPAPKGRPQQKKERPSPLVQQPKKGPTTVEKLTKALSALDGSSPEAQVLRESLDLCPSLQNQSVCHQTKFVRQLWRRLRGSRRPLQLWGQTIRNQCWRKLCRRSRRRRS